MQDHDWDDLKIVLAIERAGTLAEAGRRLGVNETTVARRLKRFEQVLGVRVFGHTAHAGYAATDVGRQILGRAERVELEHAQLREELGALGDAVSGVVRISTVPLILHHILIPNVAGLSAVAPELKLEFVPETRNVDLIKREADLALRFSRPQTGGLAVKAQKLGALKFGVFCAVGADPSERRSWIGYDDANKGLAQARWTDQLRTTHGGQAAQLCVTDVESALSGSVHGVGNAVLPLLLGEGDARLERVVELEPGEAMERDVWLLSHGDEAFRRSVVAVKEWLGGLRWA